MKKTQKTKEKRIRIPDRIDKVITLLPHSKNKKEAMLRAGYAPTTAHGKHTAINKQIERRLIQYMKEDLPQDKYFNLDEMLKEYEFLCTQRKDLSTKFRAISAVLSKYPDILSTNGTHENLAPILNITVRRIEEDPTPPIQINPITEQSPTNTQ